jgi:hypothetical protein
MPRYIVEYKTRRQIKEQAAVAFAWRPSGKPEVCTEEEAKRRHAFLVQCGIDGIDPEGHNEPPYHVRVKDLRVEMAHDFGDHSAACKSVMLSQYALEGDVPAGPWAKDVVN